MLGANYSFSAIGTEWSIETEQPITVAEQQHIQATIESFDKTYSRFRSDSLVRQVAAASDGGLYTFPQSIELLWNFYQALYEVTEGAVNPLVGASLEALGYDATYSLTPTQILPAPSLEAVTLNSPQFQTTQPVLLDIGAIGKGLLVDSITEIIAALHQYYVIDASGDMRMHTREPQTIGLEHPDANDQVIGTFQITQGSVCASATNRRAWGDDLHHIIDARTGIPTDSNVVATWALAPTTMRADGLATGLFFASEKTLFDRFGHFYYVVLYKDGGVKHNLTKEVGELF